jgi:hypothetical protein
LSDGKDNYSALSKTDLDDAYIIYSNYGIIVYDELNHGGTVYLNYENNTTNVSFHIPTPNNNKAAGIKVYYKGTLLP